MTLRSRIRTDSNLWTQIYPDGSWIPAVSFDQRDSREPTEKTHCVWFSRERSGGSWSGWRSTIILAFVIQMVDQLVKHSVWCILIGRNPQTNQISTRQRSNKQRSIEEVRTLHRTSERTGPSKTWETGTTPSEPEVQNPIPTLSDDVWRDNDHSPHIRADVWYQTIVFTDSYQIYLSKPSVGPLRVWIDDKFDSWTHWVLPFTLVI
jgi:hypothetical protein